VRRKHLQDLKVYLLKFLLVGLKTGICAKKNSPAELQQNCLNYLLIHQINQKAECYRKRVSILSPENLASPKK
jgi:hypothetical protein